jgi:hypothetical protein
MKVAERFIPTIEAGTPGLKALCAKGAHLIMKRLYGSELHTADDMGQGSSKILPGRICSALAT